MKRLNTGWSFLVVAACLVASGVVRTSQADDNSRTPADTATETAESGAATAEAKPIHEREEIVAMWKKSNELRASVGLEPQRLSPELCKAAQDHAEYMARTGVFDHYANGGPSGRAMRYEYSGSVRENIAMGYGSVESAFAGWRSSGGHWASIVSGTQDAGFGYAVNENGTPYYVGVYGYPAQRVAKPVVPETEASGSQENRSEENGTVAESSNDGVVYTSRRRRRRGRRRR